MEFLEHQGRAEDTLNTKLHSIEFRCLTPFKRAQTRVYTSRVQSGPILRMRGQTNSRTIDQAGAVLTVPSAAARSSVYNGEEKRSWHLSLTHLSRAGMGERESPIAHTNNGRALPLGD